MHSMSRGVSCKLNPKRLGGCYDSDNDDSSSDDVDKF